MALSKFTPQATVRCEPPNSRLYHFTGNLELPSLLSPEPLVVSAPPASVLLRGCSLRNTHRVIGMVIYAGHDTKIFMNSTQPPSKRSHVERTVDRIIFVMFTLLFAMCLVGSIYFANWTVIGLAKGHNWQSGALLVNLPPVTSTSRHHITPFPSSPIIDASHAGALVPGSPPRAARVRPLQASACCRHQLHHLVHPLQ